MNKVTMKITKDTDTDDLPYVVDVVLSNFAIIRCPRATLMAYLKRWYYDSMNDKIKFAFIKII